MSLGLFASSDDLLVLVIFLKVRAHADREPRIGHTEQRQNIPARFPAPSFPNLGLDPWRPGQRPSCSPLQWRDLRQVDSRT